MGRDHRVRHAPEQCKKAADLIGSGMHQFAIDRKAELLALDEE
jgi:hypothetical protein